jgi:hypothetical protein
MLATSRARRLCSIATRLATPAQSPLPCAGAKQCRLLGSVGGSDQGGNGADDDADRGRARAAAERRAELRRQQRAREAAEAAYGNFTFEERLEICNTCDQAALRVRGYVCCLLLSASMYVLACDVQPASHSCTTQIGTLYTRLTLD